MNLDSYSFSEIVRVFLRCNQRIAPFVKCFACSKCEMKGRRRSDFTRAKREISNVNSGLPVRHKIKAKPCM